MDRSSRSARGACGDGGGRGAALAAAAVAWALPCVALAQSNGFYRELYPNPTSNNTLAAFTNSAAYPDGVTSDAIVNGPLETPQNTADGYGQRIRAQLRPPTNGVYIFQICSDDASVLYLGTSSNPSSKRQIAILNGWATYNNFTANVSQTSSPITLFSNQTYYLEALHVEGAGGDHLIVRWRGTNSLAWEQPVAASRLTPYGMEPPVITGHPASAAGVENGAVGFTTTVFRAASMGYQWYRNGQPLAGATAPVLSVGPLVPADAGSAFLCILTNLGGAATSSVATITSVAPDTVPPSIASVSAACNPEWITVIFSERITEATATNASNYLLNGAPVLSAQLSSDGLTVYLRTAARTADAPYTLSVSGLQDRAATPNTISPGAGAGFVEPAPVPLELGRVRGAPEPAGPASRRTGLVISEIHYNPAPRTDGRNVEFVELLNTQAWFEDLSGWRLRGELDVDFPNGTYLGAGEYILVAPSPADVQAAYPGLTNRIFAGNPLDRLGNGGGTVRLENDQGATLLEVDYDNASPWPAAADGAGHSLVLARPSFGQADIRSWAASANVGGSPGAADPAPAADAPRYVVLNEILAHTDLPDVDFIELHNLSTNPVNIGGCVLTDDPALDRFVIPTNTVIPARGFISFTQSQLGFALDAAGETVLFRDSAGGRVLDAIRFGAQENGVAFGRSPDGAPDWSRLQTKTPGARNGPFRPPDVAISELMYHPISDREDDEFVELFNRTAAPVSLAGWRLEDGIAYTFPSNAVIPASNYVVVARNLARFQELYPSVPAARVFGDYDGALSDAGERIALSRPDDLVSTNGLGQSVTNIIHIVVEETTYFDGGRWGVWSDGGGSSLERIDPSADARRPGNWADSDESSKSGWVNLEISAPLDNGVYNTGIPVYPNQLHLMQLGKGEMLVDNVELFSPFDAASNFVPNGTFDAGTAGWTFQGTHDFSSWESGGGFGGGGCLHVRAANRGDTGANRIRVNLTSQVPTNSTATIRARVRWLKGWPEALLRIKGNWVELTGNILTTRAFGTPGAPNGRPFANAGPSIFDVSHAPILPASNQPATVSARLQDHDGISSATLYYRVDPSTNYAPVLLSARGAGFYAADIPPPPSNAVAAFFIEARDGGGAVSRFPADAPAHEALVRWGETQPPVQLGVYRLWITAATELDWRTREKNSNRWLDGTFVYGDRRVVYNMSTMYSGSPFHSKSYNGPMGGTMCDYSLMFPGDDLMLGEEDFVIALNADGNSGIREMTTFWMLRNLGAPYNHKRFVHMFVNGLRRTTIYEDIQQPNSEVVKQWFPDDSDGDLYKIEDWFEFDDAGYNFVNVNARLQQYRTTDGAYKTARYRWNWRKRAIVGDFSNYSNLFELVDNANMTNSPAYLDRMDRLLDEDEWIRIVMMEHFVGNYDSYGFSRGKNMFAYRPQDAPWHLLPWDIEFGLGNGGTVTTVVPTAMPIEDPVIAFYLRRPEVVRAWWRAVDDLCNRVITATPARMSDMMYNRYAALTNDLKVFNATLGTTPATVVNWILTRRTSVMAEYAGVTQTVFAAAAGNDVVVSTNAPLLTLTGSAPIGVKDILVNGVEADVTWTSVTNWSLPVAVTAPTNALVITGAGADGLGWPGATNRIVVLYTGAAADDAANAVLINEVMYNPLAPESEYVEIHNRSATTPFDLSGWRLDGVDFAFPEGTILDAGGYLAVAENWREFERAYGTNSIPLAGEFGGGLDPEGETLRLVQWGATPAEDALIDEVTFDNDLPWPAAADGFGHSLQVINPALDNNRVANWAPTGGVPWTERSVEMTNLWRYYQSGEPPANWSAAAFNDSGWPSGRALLCVEDSALPAPKNTALTIGRTSYYFRTSFICTNKPVNPTLYLTSIVDDGLVLYLNGQEVFRLGMDTGTVSYTTFANRVVSNAGLEGPFEITNASALVQGPNVLAAEVHQNSANSSDVAFGLALSITNGNLTLSNPGAPNPTADPLSWLPPLWLNEVQPNNANGAADRFGEREPWVELYNSGTQSMSLAAYRLTDTYTNLNLWSFPSNAVIPAGGFVRVWLDGEPGESTADEWHSSFRLGAGAGDLALCAVLDGAWRVVDYLKIPALSADRSYGAWPDGTPAGRRRFYYATPLAANRADEPAVQIAINEWMADNSGSVADPADGDYDDWFELHNLGTQTADLSGWTLTDNLSSPRQCVIPDGFMIEPGDFLVVWADNETSQNSVALGRLHATFKLSNSGESIGLFKADGSPVDTVSFGPQTENISQGRWPDGNGEPFSFFVQPTPGAPNILIVPTNRPPVLNAVSNAVADEQVPLQIAVTGYDPDTDQDQELTFRLAPGAPAGAIINPDSGVFTWTPTEEQGPGSYPVTVRLSDNGLPPLTNQTTFTVTVSEVDRPPVLTPHEDVASDEGEMMQFELEASDPDLPIQPLRFRLESGSPAGAAIDENYGQFQWQTGEADGPSSGAVTVTVYSPEYPSNTASTAVNVQVREVNQAPALTQPPDHRTWAGQPWQLLLTASDGDLPTNRLTYSLAPGAPAGAAVDPESGLLTWTPDANLAPSTNALTVRVTDDGAPALGDERTFRILIPSVTLQFTGLQADTGTVLLQWFSLPGRRYRVECQPLFEGTNWTFVTETTATNDVTTIPVPSAAPGQGFYRVIETTP